MWKTYKDENGFILVTNGTTGTVFAPDGTQTSIDTTGFSPATDNHRMALVDADALDVVLAYVGGFDARTLVFANVLNVTAALIQLQDANDAAHDRPKKPGAP